MGTGTGSEQVPEDLLQPRVGRARADRRRQVGRVGVNAQRLAREGDRRAEHIQLERQDDVESAVHTREHHVVADQCLVEAELAVVGHPGPRLLVQHKGNAHEVGAVHRIEQLGIGARVTVGIDRDRPIIDTGADGVEDAEHQVHFVGQQFKAGLDLGAALLGFVPIVKELVDGQSVLAQRHVDARLDARQGVRIDMHRAAARQGHELVETTQLRDPARYEPE